MNDAPIKEPRIDFYRDKFLGSTRLRGLPIKAQQVWLWSMLLHADYRYKSPTRGCLVNGKHPMTFTTWMKACGIRRRAEAVEIMETLLERGAYEKQVIDGVEYLHVYGFERNQNRLSQTMYRARQQEKPPAQLADELVEGLTRQKQPVKPAGNGKAEAVRKRIAKELAEMDAENPVIDTEAF